MSWCSRCVALLALFALHFSTLHCSPFYAACPVQVAPGESWEVRELVVRCMEGAGGESVSVPLRVDVHEGASWGEGE